MFKALLSGARQAFSVVGARHPPTFLVLRCAAPGAEAQGMGCGVAACSHRLRETRSINFNRGRSD
ncbi:hypothetical protein CUJ84_Chr002789 [Rhizobium leguminosarum]|uniref:Uncharacterized protein n=1 Tax=Rhizobium leguminosarum TaxID=384 RepID=A0A2K9Z4I1_RHILE|nr:hypothetical protein CUJ84_Chr002789 [Rhizobium leguminosarum]